MQAEYIVAENHPPGQSDERLIAEYRTRMSTLVYREVGMVAALVLSPRIDEHRSVASLAVVPNEGPVGQYPGKLWWRGARTVGRQISGVNAEVLDVLDVSYTVPGDNLVIQGIDLAQFEPGDMMRIGDLVLVATPTPHRPCAKLARRTTLAKMKAIAAGRYRGTMFDAIHSGTIHLGDTVERLLISRP